MQEAIPKSHREHLLGSEHPYAEQGLDPDPPVRSMRPVKRRLRVRDLPGIVPVVRVIAGRDFKGQYKQSLLGPIWLLVQPLGLLIAFTVVFGSIARVNTLDVPYLVFALVGLVVYTYFQAALITGTNAVVVNMALIRRASAPRIAFPTASLFSTLPILGMTFTFALVVAFASGHGPGPRGVLVLPAVLWLMVFTWCVVTLLNALTTRYRDVMYVLPFVLQMLLFVSPVAYPVSEASPRLASALEFNPLAGIIEVFRWTLLPIDSFNESTVLIAGGWTVVLAVVAWQVFTRLEPTMADYV